MVGTFGRGIFILDDYAPLRGMSEEALAAEAMLFPPRDGMVFQKSFELGYNDKAFQGDAFYSAPNPPLGAVFTYYLKEGLKTLRESGERPRRRPRKGERIGYPSWEELRREDREEEPAIVLTVRDATATSCAESPGRPRRGSHRVAWDLRYPRRTPSTSARAESVPDAADRPDGRAGDLHRVAGQEGRRRMDRARGPGELRDRPLGIATLAPPDREVLDFQSRTAAAARHRGRHRGGRRSGRTHAPPRKRLSTLPARNRRGWTGSTRSTSVWRISRSN